MTIEIHDEMTDEELRQIVIECANFLRSDTIDGGKIICDLFCKWSNDRPNAWERFASMIAKDYDPGNNFWSERVVL